VIGREPVGTPIWDLLGAARQGDWRQLITAAGDAADAGTPQLAAVAELDALIERVAPLDRTLERELSNAALEQAVALYGAGVLLGAARVRTWPTSLDGMGDWPARALAEAGLTDDEDASGEEAAADAPAAPPADAGTGPWPSAPRRAGTGPAPPAAPTSYASWADGDEEPGDWASFLTGLVTRSWDATGAGRHHNERLVALTERIGGAADSPTRTAALELMRVAEEAEYDQAVYAALLGYGLGRTAGGPESYDAAWLARAKTLVGLDAADRTGG
jgi:hypothetical protein